MPRLVRRCCHRRRRRARRRGRRERRQTRATSPGLGVSCPFPSFTVDPAWATLADQRTHSVYIFSLAHNRPGRRTYAPAMSLNRVWLLAVVALVPRPASDELGGGGGSLVAVPRLGKAEGFDRIRVRSLNVSLPRLG